MCDVTKDNFDSILPELFGHIDKCAFIAFDCEFTALDPAQNGDHNSLFDSQQSRYARLAHPPVPSIISQMGLAVFQHDIDTNTFSTRNYNFYICPRSFASVDQRFCCQANSLEFLVRYNFDFNKFIYQGISYMNRAEEAKLRASLRGGALLEPDLRKIPQQDEDLLRSLCSELAAWLATAQLGGELELRPGPLHPAVLHAEIRANFPGLWSFSNGETVMVRVVSPDQRSCLQQTEAEDELSLPEKLVDSMLGFTKVIRYISKSGKVYIGHNCLLDLLKIYHQFVQPLPPTYKEFKREIHKFFPRLFDTKHLCYNMKRRIGSVHPDLEPLFTSSNLNLLHDVLQRKKDDYNLMWTPKVIHAEGFKHYEDKSNPHEAGYDAFLAGFCFVRIAHLAATISHLDIKRMRVLSFPELLAVLADYENRINVGRANTNHLNLGGPEPECVRPALLLVRSRGGQPLEPARVAAELAGLASADIRAVGRDAVVVAVSSHRGARSLVDKYRGPAAKWEVELYCAVRHNPVVRGLLWAAAGTGLILTTAIFYWALQ